MAQVKPPFETFARIKVIGVGGAGGNALMRMISSRIQGVEFVAANSDFQDLHKSGAPVKLQIGKNLSRGLGAGMNPEIGRQAAADAKEEITEALKGADMVFITAGMGGGTGTGASPIVAEIARDLGALTVAIVTRPFSFEGAQRSRIAEEGWNQLRDKVDSIITISNDRLLSIIDRKTPILEAFAVVDDVLRQGVQGISDLITIPGIINVDFADVKAVMANSGSALMGIGRASGGEDRAITAAKMAINSPLLEVAIDGAKGVLFNVAGGNDLSMAEINEAAKIITENIDPNAKVIFGAVQDDKLKKGEIKITVIATGFNGGMAVSPGASRSSGLLTGTQNLFDDIGRHPKNNEPAGGLVNGRNGSEQKREFMDHSLEDESIYEIPAFIRKKMKE
ncbi:MAG: cell division protein FtsZ [Parcubacteria group bacterium Gr01-1014_44]|nr:MAG: cell division protein FtsZ [Parcubacteria group bacterium Gr01-1014_44]